MDKTDEGLLGNEKIEDAIAALQQQPTQELLAHALTVVRRRMRENGQVIIAVEPNGAAGQMKLQAVKTSDGKELVGGFYQLRRRIERRQKCYVNLYDRHWKIT
ncbi:MAG: SseB family protein [Ruminococcus sp.]